MEGTPNRLIQPLMRPSAQSPAVADLSGTASAHLVERSITVSRYTKPSLDTGSGPTRSTWMCEKQQRGTAMGCSAAAARLDAFALWHC
jgi:hypothetical protein